MTGCMCVNIVSSGIYKRYLFIRLHLYKNTYIHTYIYIYIHTYILYTHRVPIHRNPTEPTALLVCRVCIITVWNQPAFCIY